MKNFAKTSIILLKMYKTICEAFGIRLIDNNVFLLQRILNTIVEVLRIFSRHVNSTTSMPLYRKNKNKNISASMPLTPFPFCSLVIEQLEKLRPLKCKAYFYLSSSLSDGRDSGLHSLVSNSSPFSFRLRFAALAVVKSSFFDDNC